MKPLTTLVLSVGTVALFATAGAATFDFDARWGWLPDQFTPAMELINDSSSEVPMLNGGVLALTNDVPSEHLGYGLADTNLTVPTNLWSEAEVLVLRNDDRTGGKRTGAGISFTIATRVGNALWLGVNEIFISSGEFTRGPSATVGTTTNFHTYRVEVDGTNVGNNVRVYQDGILKINGGFYQSAGGDHTDPSVAFGELSGLASGGSLWRSFRFNASAAASTVRPRLFIGPPQNLSVHDLPGKSYHLESTTNLTQPVWSVVTNISVTTNAMGAVTLPVDGSPQKFYRGVEIP